MNGAFRQVPKPVPVQRRCFGRASALAQGAVVLGSAVGSGYVGYRHAWKKYEEQVQVEKLIEELNLFASIRQYKKQAGLPLDGYKEENFKELFVRRKIKKPERIEKFFWKDIDAVKKDKDAKFYIKTETPIDPARVEHLSIGWAVGGGFLGLTTSIFVVAITSTVLSHMRWRSAIEKTTRLIDERFARNKMISEEQRRKAREEKEREATNRMLEKDRVETREPEVDEETKKMRKMEKEKEIELAIRSVCGGAFSREVSFVLTNVLSQRQMQLLIEEPVNLGQVLADYRQEIGKELEIYGLSVDNVLAEIKRRESNRAI